MGFPFKAVLGGLETIGAGLIPGGNIIDSAVHAAIDAKTGNEREAAIIAAVSGGIMTLDSFKPEMIENQELFNEGVIEAHDAFDKIKSSLKK